MMLNVDILHMNFLVMITNCYTKLLIISIHCERTCEMTLIIFKSFALKNYVLNLNSRDSMFANFDKILFCTDQG